MPQVPYQPYPDVTPSGQGAPELRAPQSLAEATGQTIARAVSHLGTVAEGAGAEIFSRGIQLQQLQNESDARDAVTKYALQTMDMTDNFRRNEGPAAGPEALAKHRQALADLRDQVRGSLKTPYAQKYFEQESQNWFLRNVFSASEHALTEQKHYAVQTAEAEVNTFKSWAIRNPTDIGTFRNNLDQAESTIRGHWANAHRLSPDDPLVEQEVRKVRSDITANSAVSLAGQDPFVGWEFFNRNKDELFGNDIKTAREAVLHAMRDTGARVEADKIVKSGGYDDPRSEKTPMTTLFEQARKRADELMPGDKQFAEAMVERVRGKVSMANFAVHQDVQHNLQMVGDAIQKGAKSPEEIKALGPQFKSAVEGLPPNEQNKIQGKINTYIESSTRLGREELYKQLLGMSDRDGLGFAGIDIISNFGKDLSQNQINHLRALQQQKREHPERDPRIASTLKDLDSQLREAGYDEKSDRDKFDQYRGYLMDAISIEMADRKRQLTREERRKIGLEILRDTSPWYWPRNDMLSIKPPSEEGMRITREQMRKEGLEDQSYDDVEVYRYYFRQYWIDKMSREKAQTQEPAAAPGVVPQSK